MYDWPMRATYGWLLPESRESVLDRLAAMAQSRTDSFTATDIAAEYFGRAPEDWERWRISGCLVTLVRYKRLRLSELTPDGHRYSAP